MMGSLYLRTLYNMMMLCIKYVVERDPVERVCAYVTIHWMLLLFVNQFLSVVRKKKTN